MSQTFTDPRNLADFPPLRTVAVIFLILAGYLGSIGRTTAADSATASNAVSELAQMSLEELSNIQVSSVSKHGERISDAPAAISVITGEDIRRSGVTTIAEALRLAPGMEVARLDSHNWAISARGFNDLFANKLLVLMDGRSVYTPLFSGVFWDVQDTMLENIDRIEVIRGPGASLWGANAVNGVVNIITKSAKDTQGGLLTGGYGTEETGFAGVQYGGKFSDDGYYRIYGKYFDRGPSELTSGGKNNDEWHAWRGGFRTDWQPSPQNLFTLQGDGYSGVENETYFLFNPSPAVIPTPTRIDVAGANVIGRWTHNFPSESELKVQAYYDYTARNLGWFNEDRNTADAELQYELPIGERQVVVAGTGFRYSQSYNLVSNFTVSFYPTSLGTHIFNTFVQDEIAVIENRLRLTLGSKFEWNDYTHWEIQPSGRLLWTPNENNSAWAAVSRAVRTPSRADTGSRIATALYPAGTPPFSTAVPALTSINGNPGFLSEVLTAYELGYRVQPTRIVSLDLALFYNRYDRLRSFESTTPFATTPNYVEFPSLFSNLIDGQTYGGELAGNVQVAEWWHLRASYSYLQLHLETDQGSTDTGQIPPGGYNPQNQVSFRSLMDLPMNLQFDTTLRYVGVLQTAGIPSYVGLDLRLGWRPAKDIEFSIVGQNLVQKFHAEFPPAIIMTPAAEIQRAIYGKVTIHF